MPIQKGGGYVERTGVFNCVNNIFLSIMEELFSVPYKYKIARLSLNEFFIGIDFNDGTVCCCLGTTQFHNSASLCVPFSM